LQDASFLNDDENDDDDDKEDDGMDDRDILIIQTTSKYSLNGKRSWRGQRR